MPDICSCGTQLVDGAAFCHRCGKPTRELIAEPEAIAKPEPVAAVSYGTPPPPPLKTIPVSFHNIVAVRIGLLVASVASMLDALPFIDMLFVVWSAGAGFVSVWLYRRSTGHSLSVRGGAKMGWITGVLNAVIVMVLMTLTFAASATDATAFLRQQFAASAAQDPARFARAKPFLDSPYALVVFILLCGALMFAVFTISCVAGGALGARFTRKNAPPA